MAPLLLLAGLWVAAAEENAPPTNGAPARVHAQVVPGERIGSEQVRRVRLTAGDREFEFILPRGLDLRVSPGGPGQLHISTADDRCHLTVHLRTTAGGIGSLAELKADAQHRFPGSHDIEESAIHADGQTGVGITALWSLGQATRQQVRLAWLPTPAGPLEFALVASATAGDAARELFNTVLATLRSNRGGKIESLVLLTDT